MGKEVEDAFASTTAVLLGRRLGPLDAYREWLLAHLRPFGHFKSVQSGKDILTPPLEYLRHIGAAYVTSDEAFEAGKKMLDAQAARSLSPENAPDALKPILLYSPNVVMGQNVGVEECTHYIDSSYCYRVVSFAHCKFCAYSFWPRDSEYLFGVDTVFSSKFCLKCYNSVNLTRCFEVSHSSNSSDCLFCHNVDACSECLFCTNAKSLRYAIFNHEVGKEAYLRVKKMVVEEIADKLEKDKRLDLSIFNVGARGAKA